MKLCSIPCTALLFIFAGFAANGLAEEPEYLSHVPAVAPRTWLLDGEQEALGEFCTSGPGAEAFGTLRQDFDALWMDFPFPEEPPTYGDPEPEKRTSYQVDMWRGAQDTCGRVSAIAEGAALIWLVTGEERYLEKAKDFLLKSIEWDPTEGVTWIYYNDEAHFRLWRKMPLVYDQIREELSAEEREAVINSFRVRGNLSVQWIKEADVLRLERNKPMDLRHISHPVRFMAMTGNASLALWDDLPEAREWYTFAYEWYRDIFTPFGGDDGGWAEGIAYWRGVYEHAAFQDSLSLIGDPIAYNLPYWKNTGYFQVYFVQPYFATGFGDLSNAGKFDMEPGVKHFVDHLSRVTQNHYFASWVKLYSDPRPLPTDDGMKRLYRVYPTSAEYLLRDYIGYRQPNPKPASMLELPQSRHFQDVGWVSMHSALGDPENDIMLSFKSSPYGSFSHSHADQNTFIINAYGENLAINAGYREYHRSQMHKYYTRQTISKNNILINCRGQEVQDRYSTGKIVRFENTDRYTWTTGDATVAFNTLSRKGTEVVSALRDVVFVDKRYFIIRDHVQLISPGRLDWLLHAEHPIEYDVREGQVDIHNAKAYLFGQLHFPGNEVRMNATTEFPVPVDPKYARMDFVRKSVYLTAPAVDQGHFSANTVKEKRDHLVYAVLWPSQDPADRSALKSTLLDDGTLEVVRPDGVVDHISLSDDGLEIAAP